VFQKWKREWSGMGITRRTKHIIPYISEMAEYITLKLQGGYEAWGMTVI
jgi:hypothetical protein